MSGQTLLNAVARVVGGNQPSNAQTSIPAPLNGEHDQRPYWFSGLDSGDASGVAGLAGCWSLPLESLTNTPVAMVLPDTGTDLDAYPTQGHRKIENLVHVRVMTGHGDLQSNMAALVNFDDLVQAAFNSHMTLFNEPGVVSAWCSPGTYLEVAWPEGTIYTAVQFVIHVHRSLNVTYS